MEGGCPKRGARTTHGPLSGFQDKPSSNSLFLSGRLFYDPSRLYRRCAVMRLYGESHHSPSWQNLIPNVTKSRVPVNTFPVAPRSGDGEELQGLNNGTKCQLLLSCICTVVVWHSYLCLLIFILTCLSDFFLLLEPPKRINIIVCLSVCLIFFFYSLFCAYIYKQIRCHQAVRLVYKT